MNEFDFAELNEQFTAETADLYENGLNALK
jgi:hypothetical protein